MPERDSWAARLTRSVANQVHRQRKAREWSAQKLSDACAELGMEFPRSTLADLESGRRAHISVAELLVLARALNVPPVVLLVPVGAEASAEILPGASRPPFRAAQWITGEAPFPGEDGEAYLRGIAADWRAASGGALELYRAYEREVTAEADKLRRALGLDERAASAGEDERAFIAAAAAALRREAGEHRASAERIRARAEAEGIAFPPGGAR